jgi:hypothetical protein
VHLCGETHSKPDPPTVRAAIEEQPRTTWLLLVMPGSRQNKPPNIWDYSFLRHHSIGCGPPYLFTAALNRARHY